MSYLSPSDETFTHQVSYPHAIVGSSDPSWRERYWVSIQDTQNKDTVLTLGLGQYPNQDVQEGFAVLSHGGRQRNVRLSRTLAPHNNRMQVGPLRIDLVQAFRELRFVMDDNPSGLAFDITWRSELEPVLESRHAQVQRNRVVHDAIRYVQLGRVSGAIESPEGTFDLCPETWWGERDHSWGTRPLPRTAGAPPATRPEWRMLMFCPVQFRDFGFHIYLYEAEPGRPVYLSAGLSRPWESGQDEDPVVDVQHDFTWVSGAPAVTLSRGEITMLLGSRRRLDFRLRAHPGRAYLRGGGYEGWDGWYQGHWKGDFDLEHEVWDLTDEDQLYRYAKAGSDHLIEVEHDGQVGYGIIEYILLPGYGRYQDALPSRRKQARAGGES
jgi:hypothetical protein